MGTNEPPMGDNGRSQFVRVFGHQAALSLDARGRFRIPDDLAAAVQRELGRVQGLAQGTAPASAFERLAFYMVPGTRERIFLYPLPNVPLAIRRIENPPADMQPGQIRGFRDYFFRRTRYLEADRQNRLAIPEGLRQHAGIGDDVQQIDLVAQNYWLVLTRAEAAQQRETDDREAFEQVADDLLDPLRWSPSELDGQSPETDVE